MHHLICPKCGKTSDQTQFIGPFCLKCSPIRLEAPRAFSIELCGKCGKMRIARDWVKYEDEIINRLFKRKCRGDFFKVEYDPRIETATFFVEKEGNIFKMERVVKYEPTKSICTNCTRKGSNYFEAIVQLRGRPERMAKYEKILTEALNKKTFIIKTEDLKEGRDLYVGSTKEVLSLCHELGLRTVISRKLHGVKQGKRIYRTTFLLRL